MEDADAKVAAYVLKAFRSEYNTHHLATCPDVKVEHPEMNNGMYGCDTGCDYARLEADLSCPHGERYYDYEYGTFGQIDSLIEELDRL